MSTTISTAPRIISSTGIRTVVSAGTVVAANGMSSKPTIEKSAGTLKPRSNAAWSIPIARTSVDGRDRGRRLGELEQSLEGGNAAAGRVAGVLDVALAGLDASLRDVVLVRGLTLLDVAEDRIADEGDAPVAEADQMVERGLDAVAVVDVHREEAVVPRAVPDGDDRDVDALEVLDQARLVAHVADDHDRVALSRLEHGRECESLVGALACVAEHDAVAALARLERERVDRAREERVGDVADDRPEQHRRRAPQAARVRVRPVGELGGGGEHALARLARRSGTSSGVSLRIRETVLCATPAALAMSFIVAGRRGV